MIWTSSGACYASYENMQPNIEHGGHVSWMTKHEYIAEMLL